MSESNQDRSEERMSRRTILKGGAAAGMAAVAGLVTGVPTAGASSTSHGGLLVLNVVADPGLLDLVPTPNGGPFYIPGEIFDPDTNDKVGDFHCWGFFFNGGALGVVSQEFDLFDLGKIQVQGVEDEGPRAVTGGTGNFRNVRGEMTGADLSNFPDFTVYFKLLGAGRRRFSQ